MRSHVQVLLVVLCLAMAGCSSSDDGAEEASLSTAAPDTSEAMGLDEATCQEAQEILGDLSLNDAQIAAALRSIETDSDRLAEAIEETARGFADGDASIPDVTTPMCTGDAEGAPDPTADQQRFLEDVRALDPPLVSVADNDLFASIDLACGGLDVGEAPSNRDELLGLAFPPLPEFEDGEAVLRAGVRIFCPEHQQLVEGLL